MREGPILFSAPMVRAILSGSKTQTRRVLAPRGLGFIDCCCGGTAARWVSEGDRWHCGTCGGGARLTPRDVEYLRCPYGQPGDRLWVRETWGFNPDFPRQWGHICFRADPGHEHDGIKWVPSIHMPRRASRILLEIVSVRVERLQAISEADAIAEGCTQNHNGYFWGGPHPESGLKQLATAVQAFRDLWQSINGPESWSSPIWVWVVEFKRVEVAHG